MLIASTTTTASTRSMFNNQYSYFSNWVREIQRPLLSTQFEPPNVRFVVADSTGQCNKLAESISRCFIV